MVIGSIFHITGEVDDIKGFIACGTAISRGSEVTVGSENPHEKILKGIFVQKGSSGTRFDHGQFEIKTFPIYTPPYNAKKMSVRVQPNRCNCNHTYTSFAPLHNQVSKMSCCLENLYFTLITKREVSNKPERNWIWSRAPGGGGGGFSHIKANRDVLL